MGKKLTHPYYAEGNASLEGFKKRKKERKDMLEEFFLKEKRNVLGLVGLPLIVSGVGGISTFAEREAERKMSNQMSNQKGDKDGIIFETERCKDNLMLEMKMGISRIMNKKLIPVEANDIIKKNKKKELAIEIIEYLIEMEDKIAERFEVDQLLCLNPWSKRETRLTKEMEDDIIRLDKGEEDGCYGFGISNQISKMVGSDNFCSKEKERNMYYLYEVFIYDVKSKAIFYRGFIPAGSQSDAEKIAIVESKVTEPGDFDYLVRTIGVVRKPKDVE